MIGFKAGYDINGDASGDNSAISIYLSENGNRVAILGACFNDRNSICSDHVRAYQWNNTRSDWDQMGSDIDCKASGDQSEYSVAMLEDGTKLVISTPYNDGNAIDYGHIRVYTWDSTSCDWVQMGSDIDGKERYHGYDHHGDKSHFSASVSKDG